MSTPYGNNLKLYVDGTSHGAEMKMTLTGFPEGFAVDFEALNAFLARRKPAGDYATARRETDVPVFLSGFQNGATDGTPIVAVIQNQNTVARDYQNLADTPRPSHADYPARIKYGDGVDLVGGGHFSGRLTAPFCVAGGICLQYLKKKYGITVFSHIARIGDVCDLPFSLENVGTADAATLGERDFPTLSTDAGERMTEAMDAARLAGDSLGGIVEGALVGLPIGLGEHLFAGAEARLSSALFAIPGAKGVEFGAGFESTRLFGSENNDSYRVEDGKIKIVGNRAGGILGGMTTGAPLVYRVAFKPTPSIAKEQNTVSLSKMENVKIKISGRHDACYVPRAVPVTEAAVAVAALDLILDEGEKI